MTARRHTPRQVLLVAGGIGITPMRALFETLDVAGPDLTLLYRASTPADIVFGRELAEIASRRGARLVYLIGSSTDPANAVTGDALARLVSDLAAHDVYLCASPRFAAAGRAGLRPAGVLRHQLHEEISPSDASNAQATGTQKLRRPAQQEHSRSTAGTTRLAEVSNFLAALQSAPAPLVYLLVAALVFGESSILLGLVLPGETALLTGGVLPSTGHASLAPLLVIAVVAAVAGDAVGYWIGRRVGTATRHTRVDRWVGQGRWDRAQRLMSEHGRLAVVGGRWVGVLRPLIPPLAGMTRMSSRTYMLHNLLGGLLWVGGMCGAGYLLGATLSPTTMLAATALAVLAAAAVHVLFSRYQRRSQPVHAG